MRVSGCRCFGVGGSGVQEIGGGGSGLQGFRPWGGGVADLDAPRALAPERDGYGGGSGPAERCGRELGVEGGGAVDCEEDVAWGGR